MATYNGERFLEEQLHSIECQTFMAWDLWISDDGSKDSTLEIVHKFSEKHPNKVHLLPEHAPTGSACANFFHLMREVPKTYDYYALCDQDDFWHETKLEEEVSEIERMEVKDATTLVFCDARVVDAQRNIMAESFFEYTGVNSRNVALRQLIVQNPISGAEIVANRELIELACNISSLEGIDMHDQWLGLVAASFGKISCVSKPLFDYRQHESNEVGAKKMSITTVGSKAKIAKHSILKKQLQAGKLVLECGHKMKERDLNLCKDFLNLNLVSKFSRLRWLKENDVKMNGLLRNVGLAFFI